MSQVIFIVKKQFFIERKGLEKMKAERDYTPPWNSHKNILHANSAHFHE